MSEFEKYSKGLLEASKQLLARANGVEDGEQQALLRSSLFHGFCFLEAQINHISSHFESSNVFGTLEKSLLLERDVELKGGQFLVSKRTKFYGLEDRVEFFIAAFSTDIPKSKGTWFSQLTEAIKLRNKLVHPRTPHRLKSTEVERALTAILDCVSALYLCVFNKQFPLAKVGLRARSGSSTKAKN